jgi:cysteinyl-tRNA synthetase
MAVEELGFGFDIHGGGLDLIFPHHENEVAQAEGAVGQRPFARYWLHNGMVRLKGEKMAKSLGNVVGLLDLVRDHRPLAIRLFYLRAQYRQPIDFSPELVDDAEAALDRLWAFRRRAGVIEAAADTDAVQRFTAAMDEDFNTAEAMGVVFDVVRDGNRSLDAGEDVGPYAAAYDAFVDVLGLREPQADLAGLEGAVAAVAARFGVVGSDTSAALADLVVARSAARSDRDFARADGIRDALGEVGVVLEDGPDGTTWHRR